MGLFSKWHLVDLDDLFAYKTPRTVVIRDRKLGISRWLLLLGIFAYVVIYEVILEKGYLVKETPVAFTRVSTMANPTDPPVEQPYCCTTEGCTDFAFGSRRGKLQCVMWDEYNAVVPPAEEFSTFITTRVSVTKYDPVPERCILNATSLTQAPCPSFKPTAPAQPWNSVKTSYYVTGVEDMTLLLRHAVYGRKNNLVLENTQDMVKGRLADHSGNYFVNFCDLENKDMDKTCEGDNPAKNRPGDIIPLRTIFKAGGMTTNSTLDVINAGFTNDTMRYDGIVLLVVIDYAGTGVQKNSVKYTYRVKHVPGAEHKYEEVRDIYRPDPSNANQFLVHREVWNRHGVRIVLVPAGWMGKFSFTEMMKTLVTGLGLLALATTITDYIIMRLLPRAPEYRRYKRVRTVDFSDLQGKGRTLAKGKELTWGGRFLNDEAFVYGELSDSEKERGEEYRKLHTEEMSKEQGEEMAQPAGQSPAGANPLLNEPWDSHGNTYKPTAY